MFNKPEKITMEQHGNHEELLAAAWEKSQLNGVIQQLNAGQKIATVIEKIPGFKEAFDHELDILDCSDGRVRSGAKLGLAGEGIVADSQEKEIITAALIRQRERLGRPLTITGHEGCGAAALMYPGPDSDQHGYQSAKDMAEKTGNQYKEVDHSQFISPVHNERLLLIEATGHFDAANWENFPPQFISSAPFFKLGDAYLQKELPALTGIALGDHGLGERFTAETPFYIIVSANDETELKQLTAKAVEILKPFGDRVKIDGFIAPNQKK
ncbi:MAG: hypothetical protein WC523_02220 [Patescibacteria group bacterium]|jgi:hypothetical protein